MTILIVEDDATLGKALERGLTELGHDCVWAKTGSKGLDLALTQKFDAVVLDLMLPEVNGPTCCGKSDGRASARRSSS